MPDLINLLKNDPARMHVLSIVQKLGLPDCYVAAGFLRNLAWDSLYSTNTPLNDIDVVFHDKSDRDNTTAARVSEKLNSRYPDYTWDVNNQVFMHVANGDKPYQDTLDAMGYWPEKETAVGAALNEAGSITVVSVFGLESLFAGKVSHNGKRSKEIFLHRVATKRWLKIWPQLQLVFADAVTSG